MECVEYITLAGKTTENHVELFYFQNSMFPQLSKDNKIFPFRSVKRERPVNLIAFHIHGSTATIVSPGNCTPSQVTNQDLAGRFLLFYNQSDKSPDSGLLASDSSNKCIRQGDPCLNTKRRDMSVLRGSAHQSKIPMKQFHWLRNQRAFFFMLTCPDFLSRQFNF